MMPESEEYNTIPAPASAFRRSEITFKLSLESQTFTKRFILKIISQNFNMNTQYEYNKLIMFMWIDN